MSTSQCAVYQVKDTPEYRDVRFRSYEKLKSEGKTGPTYKEQVDIFLMFPVRCFCLDIYTIDTVKHIEVVYIYRTSISFHG